MITSCSFVVELNFSAKSTMILPHLGKTLNEGYSDMKLKTDNKRANNKISKLKYLELRATGNHLNPINSHTSHISTALFHSQVYQQKHPQAASKHFHCLS